MYPYPKTGPIRINTQFTGLRSFTRRNFDTISWQSLPSVTEFRSGGFRSGIVKSDYISPTPYQVWWSEVEPTIGTYVGGSRYVIGPPMRTNYAAASQRVSAHRDYGIRLLHGVFPENSTTKLPVALRDLTKLGPLVPYFADLDNMILLALANQTNNLAVTIAEMSKTSRYFLRTMLSLTKGLTALSEASPKNFRRWLKNTYRKTFHKDIFNPTYNDFESQRRRARKHLRHMPWDKKIGSRWLEYNYAILPIVFDIKGLIELNDMSTWRPLVFTLKRRHAVILKGSASPSVKQYILHAKCLVGRTFMIEDPLKFAANRIGFTLPQVALGVAWELIPFSFVADWVLGFNDLFKAAGAMQGVTYVSGYASTLFTSVTDSGRDDIPVKNLGTLTGTVRPTLSIDDAAAKLNPSVFNSECVGNRASSSGFQRVLLGKPSYSYSTSLSRLKGIGTEYVTLLSLLAQLRKVERV